MPTTCRSPLHAQLAQETLGIIEGCPAYAVPGDIAGTFSRVDDLIAAFKRSGA